MAAFSDDRGASTPNQDTERVIGPGVQFRDVYRKLGGPPSIGAGCLTLGEETTGGNHLQVPRHFRSLARIQ